VVCCSAHKLSCSNAEKQRPQSEGNGDDGGKVERQALIEGVKGEEILGHKNSLNERILTETEKQKLRSSELIRSQLRSKRLVSDLLKIDTAEERQEELKRARNNPDFEQFVNTLLSVLKE
jgi:hypothetical protein